MSEAMTAMTIRVPPVLKRAVVKEAEKRGMSVQKMMIEWFETELRRQSKEKLK